MQVDDHSRSAIIDSTASTIPSINSTTLNNQGESSSINDATSQTILPIIVPSFSESSSNILETHQKATATQAEQQSQENLTGQAATSNNEYINPRGIRFTTESPTNESAKGKNSEFC